MTDWTDGIPTEATMTTSAGVPRGDANEPRTVNVHGSVAGLAQEILVGQHRLSGDEPVSAGGTDTGPNPVDRDLELTGALSEAQRVRLLEIANKCPVHRTLTSEIDIRTRLTRGDPA